MESNSIDDLNELLALLSSGEKDLHSDQKGPVIEIWKESAEYPGKMSNSAGRMLTLEEFEFYKERMAWSGTGILGYYLNRRK
jgi:hypothetical protein